LAWLLVLTRLPESLPEEGSARHEARVLTWRGVADTISEPRVGLLVLLGFLAVLSFAALEGTFSLFLQGRLGWQARDAAVRVAWLGLVSAIVQGGLIRRLVPRFGEPRLILAGLLTAIVGYLAMTQVRGTATLLGAVLVVGVGQGLTGPSVQGLLSRATPESEQGAVFGVLGSAPALARLAHF